MTSFPQIVVGCYEEFVLGYNLQFENKKAIKCKLNQSFATHSHQASVRCIAAHNHLMASSGADEYINIYDMNEMEVSTVINYHNSTVTCLEFTPDGSHLVTANQNGDIAIFRCRDWTLVKLWKEAHKHANGVTSISTHPSGSVLLTAGADNIIRFWNLVKGRQAYATNFSKKTSVGNSLNFGLWSKNGMYYAVCVGSALEIYKTEKAALLYEAKASARIISSAFVKKNLICLAVEDGSVEIHSIKEKKLVLKKQAHETRVKSLSSFDIKVLKQGEDIIKSYIVSVDSKGGIKLWQFKKKGSNYSLNLRGKADCGCRITCLTVVESKEMKKENNEVPELDILHNIVQETVTVPPNEKMNITNNNNNNKQRVSCKTNEKNLKRKITELDVSHLENGNSKPIKTGFPADLNSAEKRLKTEKKKGGLKNKEENNSDSTSKLMKFNKKKSPNSQISKKKRKI